MRKFNLIGSSIREKEQKSEGQ